MSDALPFATLAEMEEAVKVRLHGEVRGIEVRVNLVAIQRLYATARAGQEDRSRLDYLETRFAALKPGRELALWRDRYRPTETVRQAIDAAKETTLYSERVSSDGGDDL